MIIPYYYGFRDHHSRAPAIEPARNRNAKFAMTGGPDACGRVLSCRCVNVGCVPKKLMVYGSHYPHDAHEAKVTAPSCVP